MTSANENLEYFVSQAREWHPSNCNLISKYGYFKAPQLSNSHNFLVAFRDGYADVYMIRRKVQQQDWQLLNVVQIMSVKTELEALFVKGRYFSCSPDGLLVAKVTVSNAKSIEGWAYMRISPHKLSVRLECNHQVLSETNADRAIEFDGTDPSNREGNNFKFDLTDIDYPAYNISQIYIVCPELCLPIPYDRYLQDINHQYATINKQLSHSPLYAEVFAASSQVEANTHWSQSLCILFFDEQITSSEFYQNFWHLVDNTILNLPQGMQVLIVLTNLPPILLVHECKLLSITRSAKVSLTSKAAFTDVLSNFRNKTILMMNSSRVLDAAMIAILDRYYGALGSSGNWEPQLMHTPNPCLIASLDQVRMVARRIVDAETGLPKVNALPCKVNFYENHLSDPRPLVLVIDEADKDEVFDWWNKFSTANFGRTMPVLEISRRGLRISCGDTLCRIVDNFDEDPVDSTLHSALKEILPRKIIAIGKNIFEIIRAACIDIETECFEIDHHNGREEYRLEYLVSQLADGVISIPHSLTSWYPKTFNDAITSYRDNLNIHDGSPLACWYSGEYKSQFDLLLDELSELGIRKLVLPYDATIGKCDISEIARVDSPVDVLKHRPLCTVILNPMDPALHMFVNMGIPTLVIGTPRLYLSLARNLRYFTNFKDIKLYIASLYRQKGLVEAKIEEQERFVDTLCKPYTIKLLARFA